MRTWRAFAPLLLTSCLIGQTHIANLGSEPAPYIPDDRLSYAADLPGPIPVQPAEEFRSNEGSFQSLNPAEAAGPLPYYPAFYPQYQPYRAASAGLLISRPLRHHASNAVVAAPLSCHPHPRGLLFAPHR